MDAPKQGVSDDVELVQGKATTGSSDTTNTPAPTVTPIITPPPVSEASDTGFKHAFRRSNPVPMIDNLRTILILLVILYNSVLETVANSPEQNEETSPVQFLLLSNFVGLYRNFVIGLLFFVSGFGTTLSLNVYTKSVSLFLFRKSMRAMVLCLASVGAPLLSHYVFGPRPKDPEPRQSYYASQLGRISLLLGPFSYLALLFCFDFSYALFRIFRRKVGIQTSLFRYTLWVLLAFVVLTSWSIAAAGGYTPSVASIWPQYTILTYDRHFPMQYIIGYLTGIFLPSIWAFYLPKSPSRRAIPTFLFRFFFLCATFTGLSLLSPEMNDQLQYANPKMPPSFMEPKNSTKPAGINKPVILYGLWSTLVYFYMTHSFHLFFLSEATENAVSGLKKDWGPASRLSRTQIFINIFFVIFFARHVGWINHIILRCTFVWAATALSGYMLAAVCENIIWGITVRLFGKTTDLKQWDTIQFIWNHINGTVDEKSVKAFKALLGDDKSREVMEMEAGTPEALEAAVVVSGEMITNTTAQKSINLPNKQTDEIDENQDPASDSISEDDQPDDTFKARSHNIDNLRTTLIILLVLRYAVVQTIANAPEQTEAKAPVQFAILNAFVNLNRTTAVAMLYFISGMWSTHTMEVQKWSRLRYLRTKALRSVFFIIAYFAASRLIRYVYYRGSIDPLATPKDDEFILTEGSMFYVLLLFIFDCIYAFTTKNPNPSNSLSTFDLPLTQYIYAKAIYGWACRFLTMGLVYALTCIWKVDTSFFYLDPQFLGLYAIAYFAGVHYSSIIVYTFLSANILGGKPALTLFLRILASIAYLRVASTIRPLMSLGMLSKQDSQAQCPTWSMDLSYGFFVPSIFFVLGPSILLLFFHKPPLMKSWGLFSQVIYVQPVIQTFLVIELARHTEWIGNLIARCVFVGVASVISGWIAAIIPMVVWRFLMGSKLNRSRYQPLNSAENV